MDPWCPSWLARLLGQADSWTLSTTGSWLNISVGGAAQRLTIEAVRGLQPRRGVIWSSVTLPTPEGAVTLGGIRRDVLHSMLAGLAAALDEHDRLRNLKALFSRESAAIASWWGRVGSEWHDLAHRWIPGEVLRQWQANRPGPDLTFLDAYNETELEDFIRSHANATHEAIREWQRDDLPGRVARRNETFVVSERQALADFFNTVEKSPLTDEQVDAVVRFDNRVRVIASAGSGKTSTMVARAAYTLMRRIATADQILMLAFNKEAAKEIGDRVKARVGDAAESVSAETFHAFGMRVIGEATGKKPRLGAGIERDNGIRRLQDIVDTLREDDPQFRRSWDLFRLVFARNLPEPGEEETPTDWDYGRKRAGYRTLNGEVVKSQEERLIANWLFYNGVAYEYERPYPHDTADSRHGQYNPDFYYPGIDAYHEHWAIGADGRAPSSFAGYEEGMKWKKRLHADRGTTLLETSSATVRDGSAFDHLARELTKRGIVLDENPYREIPGEEPLEDHQLVAFVRTFMTHAKSNRLTSEELAARAQRLFGTSARARLFLQFYSAIFQRWQTDLDRAKEIDFEDMINRATDLLEAGHWKSPYTVVMVDEMQDSSNARARLVQALVKQPGVYLYAVGDDWQSINRFAGADLSVMTDFAGWFGEDLTVWLQRTFRSSQSICDVAGTFVTQNPQQIAKKVQSSQPEHHPTIRAITVPSKGKYAAVIADYLTGLDEAQPDDAPRKATVFILGRYKKTATDLDEIRQMSWRNLEVKFSTVHSSKGKESDYVIIPGLVSGGFPSAIEDDPLLSLAMPQGDAFPHAEERRLFYVALTRARRTVLLLTVTKRESPFLLEQVKRGEVKLETASGEDATPIMCPKCKTNRMVQRNGKNGAFYGCSTFPSCRGTTNIATVGTPPTLAKTQP